MKILSIKSGVLILSALLLVQMADAQRTGRRRGTQPPANNQTNQQTQQTNNTTQPAYNPYGNIPIRVDSSGISDTATRKSLRSEDAFGNRSLTERKPLPYENLRWDDALFSEIVWRDLDLKEKINRPFTYEAESDNGSQIFVNILLKAINSGEVTAFSDERFTTPMSLPEIQQLTVGSADTVARVDPNRPDVPLEYVVTRANFDAKSVTKIRIKEQWIFDREASRMFVRILGIAPMKTLYLPSGKERGTSIMFWVYYPDMRNTFARYEVYNPKNMGQSRMTWEELFEGRMFSSYITKSSFDNPYDLTLAGIYPTNSLFRLLEGENIKDKIFNYEQEQWQY